MESETRCKWPLSWHLLQCSHGSRVWLPRRCRRCSGCKQARRNKVLARIAGGLDGQPNSALLTLTTAPGTDWIKTMRAWQHMVKFLRKTSPKLEYAACKEEGSKNGMRHLHVILLNLNYTPQHLIAKRWRELTGAFVVRVERLRSDRAAVYVAKYVSKDLDAARKHVTFSKGYPPLPPPDVRLTHVAEAGPLGPNRVSLWTNHPGIVDFIVTDCPCFGDTHPVTMEEHRWLRFLQDHSPPVYRESSAQ